MEVEIRLGIFKETYFDTNISKEVFDRISLELVKKKEKIMIKVIKKDKEGYNLYYDNKELKKVEKYSKELINNNDIPEYSVRFSRSLEKTKKIKKLVKQKNITGIMLKIRTEYKHKTITGWRWDFTRLYRLKKDCNIMDIYKKLMKDDNLDLSLFDAKNPIYQCEIEYLGKKNKLGISPKIGEWIKENYIVEIDKTVEVQDYLRGKIKPSMVKALEHKYWKRIKKGCYSIGEKIDGIRKFIYLDSYGNIYELAQFFETINKKGKTEIYKTLLDTEKVGDNYYCFDILIKDGKDIREKTFLERRIELEEVVDKLSNNFILKDFRTAMTEEEVLSISREMYEEEKEYEKDGLIFTYNNGNYREASYKWKPLRELTIDFLLIKDEEPKLYNTIHRESGEKLGKMVIIRNTKKILKNKFGISRKVKPLNYLIESCVNISCDEVEDYETGDIIECYYDTELEYWRVHRLREDKTLRFKKTLNKEKILGPNAYLTAINTIKLIENPINLF